MPARMHSAYARIGSGPRCQTPWLGLGMEAGIITAAGQLDMAKGNATRPVRPRPGTHGHHGASACDLVDGLLQALGAQLVGRQLLAVDVDGRRTGRSAVVGGLAHRL